MTRIQAFPANDSEGWRRDVSTKKMKTSVRRVGMRHSVEDEDLVSVLCFFVSL